jgi:hypothetical protein
MKKEKTVIKKTKHVTYTYDVLDNYGRISSFNSLTGATKYSDYVVKERKVLDYIKPRGVTLVVNEGYKGFYKVLPAFIGFNGVPFCDIMKDRQIDHYMNLENSVERYSSIRGNLPDVLKRAYKVADENCKSSFDRWDGGYHYYWDIKYGNSECLCDCHPKHWTKNVLWYNWDGKEFTTNDPNCKLTTKDFS